MCYNTDAMKDEPKRPAHRPPLPPEERKSEMIRVRVTPAQMAKFVRLGAETWLRRMIDKSRD